MADAVVNDEYIKAITAKISKEVEQFEKDYAEYIKLIEKLIKEGIMEGETADAFGLFLNNISKLSKKVEDAAGSVEVTGEEYIFAVNDADGDLYPDPA